MTNNQLLKINISWNRHATNPRYLYAYVESKLILLRTNDFPDEPLYTIINDLDLTDIDDLPSNWIVPNIGDIVFGA